MEFVFLLMNDELMLVNGDYELNLCLWCFFWWLFGFVTLCDFVFVTLSLLYYIDKRDRERVEFVEIIEYISVVFDCLLVDDCILIY